MKMWIPLFRKWPKLSDGSHNDMVIYFLLPDMPPLQKQSTESRYQIVFVVS